jgi:hypothetical protein
MSAIFDLLYREYCRARLAEMRKQLLRVSVANDETSEMNWDASNPAVSGDWDGGLGEGDVTKEAPTISVAGPRNSGGGPRPAGQSDA